MIADPGADILRGKLYAYMKSVLPEGRTHMEMEEAFPEYASSGVRTRANELTKAGLLADTGERRMSPHGRRAVVWKAFEGA